MEKNSGLGLAIKIVDGKLDSKLKAKGLNKFETVGLLFFQILRVCEDIEKETIKKE